jgi:hypothetical protein
MLAVFSVVNKRSCSGDNTRILASRHSSTAARTSRAPLSGWIQGRLDLKQSRGNSHVIVHVYTTNNTTTHLPTMSFAPRSTTIRPTSGLNLGGSQNSQSSALQARIHEKKGELESLRQLRDLSAGLAGQMQQLEEKLATLSDGTESVAAVMANWGSVLRAVSMASGKSNGRSWLCDCSAVIGG